MRTRWRTKVRPYPQAGSRFKPRTELLIERPQVAAVGFALFLAGLTRPALKCADEPVGVDQMGRQLV